MKIEQLITDLLIKIHVPEALSHYLSITILLLAILLISWTVKVIFRHYFISFIRRLVSHTKNRWDDKLYNSKLPERFASLIPVVCIYFITDAVFIHGAGGLLRYIHLICIIFIILYSVFVIDSLLNTIEQIYNTYSISTETPIKSLLQLVKVIVYLIATIVIISLLIDQSPWALIKALGVVAAGFVFIFKDTILGFVATVQLSGQKMLRKGDWIEMPQYGANGDVVDVTLTTVKVQNFDKTIVYVPTYSLVSNSFQNWRGMVDSGGRRIKRSINLNMHSFKFLNTEEIESLKKIGILKEYLTEKAKELHQHNRNSGISDDSIVNGRRLTNIGTFRYYVKTYLKRHAKIHDKLTFIVRQLQPTSQGLPLEIYVFTNDTNWVNYEEIQADIFDHILTAVPEFGLTVYQEPSGSDFRDFRKSL